MLDWYGIKYKLSHFSLFNFSTDNIGEVVAAIIKVDQICRRKMILLYCLTLSMASVSIAAKASPGSPEYALYYYCQII